MAVDGMWTLTDDGEFVLDEEYAQQLKEVHRKAAAAWAATIINYLVERTSYSGEQLMQELLRRCEEKGMGPTEIVDEFVLEALNGDLYATYA